MNRLQDQVITFGQDFILEMGKPEDNFGQNIPVEIYLGKAAGFVS